MGRAEVLSSGCWSGETSVDQQAAEIRWFPWSRSTPNLAFDRLLGQVQPVQLGHQESWRLLREDDNNNQKGAPAPRRGGG